MYFYSIQIHFKGICLTTMYHTEKIVLQVEHEQVIVALRNDDIVHVQFLPNTEITVALQAVLIDLYEQVTKGKKALFIFEGGEFVSITKEARENAVKMENRTPTLASAIMVKNLGQKIIADFYYKVNKPKQPYKVFWSFDKGIDWLKSLNLTE